MLDPLERDTERRGDRRGSEVVGGGAQPAGGHDDACDSAKRFNVWTMRPALSSTATASITSKPRAVSSAASQLALVLTISPRVSSVPIERMAAVMGSARLSRREDRGTRWSGQTRRRGRGHTG